MSKKVTFSDNVLIREMSIDKLTHSLEVKNPFSDKGGSDNSGLIFIILTVSAIICILLFIWWRKHK